MTVWRIACWITEATDAHLEYVILIAFARRQWLYELASILRLTHIACFVSSLHFHFVLSLSCVLVVHVFYDEASTQVSRLYSRGDGQTARELCASGRRWNCSSNLPLQIMVVVYI